MLTSMTGFGRGEASGADVAVSVEIRSVNNRFLDVQIRGPREYAPLEAALLRRVKERFRRGRLEVSVRRQPSRTQAVVEPDAALFQAWMGAIEALLAGRGELERGQAVAFALAQPGVLEARVADADVAAEEAVMLAALDAAADELTAMREAEGRELRADLERHLAELLTHVDAVEQVVADLDQRHLERLTARVERLVGDRLEPWRLAQEAALLADKADVSEELARLRSHEVQLREALDRGEAVGRRLDFLLQEMNREVNTVASKTTDHDVAHRVVEMKTLLERMREQAANVE